MVDELSYHRKKLVVFFVFVSFEIEKLVNNSFSKFFEPRFHHRFQNFSYIYNLDQWNKLLFTFFGYSPLGLLNFFLERMLLFVYGRWLRCFVAL